MPYLLHELSKSLPAGLEELLPTVIKRVPVVMNV